MVTLGSGSMVSKNRCEYASCGLYGCVATEITTGRRTKNKICKNRVLESPPHFILENYGKTKKKIRQGLLKLVTREKVLAPHNARPKTIPLIKYAKVV